MGAVTSIGTVVWIYRQKLISAVMFMLVLGTYILIRPYLNACAPDMIGKGIGPKVIACVSQYFSSQK